MYVVAFLFCSIAHTVLRDKATLKAVVELRSVHFPHLISRSSRVLPRSVYAIRLRLWMPSNFDSASCWLHETAKWSASSYVFSYMARHFQIP
jgi:hypothetical protein